VSDDQTLDEIQAVDAAVPPPEVSAEPEDASPEIEETPTESEDAPTESQDAHSESETGATEAEDVDSESEEDPSEAENAGSELEIRVIDDGIKRRWYAIHAHSGQEGNVRRNLMVLAELEDLTSKIANVLVPMEKVAEIKSGQKRISKRKFFPGYVLVQLPEHPEKDADLWHKIKDTPGVTGFIGSRHEPVPLEDAEVQAILEEIRGERERPKPKVKFEDGERVKIIDGPFANFLGNIDEINPDRGKLKIMVEIFERLTSVEVEFWQVEKM